MTSIWTTISIKEIYLEFFKSINFTIINIKIFNYIYILQLLMLKS